MGFIKGLFKGETENINDNINGNEYYNIKTEDAMNEEGGAKMILLEPRAFSESQQIADHLKNRNSVVVNFKRVTAAQAKRIIEDGKKDAERLKKEAILQAKDEMIKQKDEFEKDAQYRKKELQDIADENIYIEMNNKCESLNVGVATSIILYELGR